MLKKNKAKDKAQELIDKLNNGDGGGGSGSGDDYNNPDTAAVVLPDGTVTNLNFWLRSSPCSNSNTQNNYRFVTEYYGVTTTYFTTDDDGNHILKNNCINIKYPLNYNTHIQEVIVQHELERREAQPGTYNPRFLVPVRATFPFPCTVRIYAGSTSDTNPALLHEYEHEPNDAHWHIIDYTNIPHYISTSNIYWEISITDEVYNNIVMLSYAGMIFSFNLIALTTQWKASFMQDPAYTSSYTRNKLYLEYINSPVLSQKWLREHGLLDDEILERIYTIAETTSTTELNNHRDFMSAWFGTLVEEAFGKSASDFLNEFKTITLSALDPSASSSGSIYMSAFLETASFLTSDTQVQIIDRSNSNTTPTFYSRNAYKLNEFFIIRYQAPRTMKDASSIVDVSAALLRQYFIHLFFDVSLSGTDGGPVLWIPTLKSID